jgi:hypothetical protein
VRAPRAASPKRCSHDEDRRPGDHTCPRCACARAGTIGGRQDQSALSVVRAYVRCQLQAFVADHRARATARSRQRRWRLTRTSSSADWS